MRLKERERKNERDGVGLNKATVGWGGGTLFIIYMEVLILTATVTSSYHLGK